MAMLSITKLVTFMVGILAANCTRIPMEIVQLTSTQMTSSSTSGGGVNSNNNTAHQQIDADPTAAAAIRATASTKVVNGFELHTTFDQQQRKGRQLIDSFALHPPRILYQVGVSVAGFDRSFFRSHVFPFSHWALALHFRLECQQVRQCHIDRSTQRTTKCSAKQHTYIDSNRLPVPNTL